MPIANLKLQSNSFRFYVEYTKSMKPIDSIVTNYCIQYIKLSVGNTRANNKYNFYRNDSKFKGFYFETRLKDMINRLPCKISKSGLKRSLNRLQNVYGILFKHKTHKAYLQIFMPFLDNAISKYLKKSYHTAINIKIITRVQNKLSAEVKKSLVVSSKRTQWRVQKEPSINDRECNHREDNYRKYNDSHDGQNHQSNNNENKSDNKYKIKSFGLPNNVMALISNNASSKREAIDYVTNISKGKQDGNMKFWYKDIYGSVYYKNEDNPYIQNYLEPKLKKWLSKIKSPKDLRNAVETDYLKYMCSHTDFQLKNKEANSDRNLYANWTVFTYQDNLKINYENMKKYKGSDTKKYNKAKKRYDQLNDLAHRYLNMPMEYVKYSKKDIEVSKHSKPHKVNPKLIATVKKSLYDLNHKGGITTDSNGVQHAHVNRSIYSDRRKPKQHYALH